MTEQIKELEKALRGSLMHENECAFVHTSTIQLCLVSLKAWEEVLQELEKERDFFTNIRGEYGRGAVFANSKAIDIINQHLEIKEGEEYERI